jgi:hypothetical protein
MTVEELAKDKGKLFDYFLKVVKQDNKDIADVLVEYIKDPLVLAYYAAHFKTGLPSKQEEIVLKSRRPDILALYAQAIGKPLDADQEAIIAKDGKSSYRYSVYALGHRFEKGEEAIKKSEYLKSYINALREWGEQSEFFNKYPDLKEKFQTEEEKEEERKKWEAEGKVPEPAEEEWVRQYTRGNINLKNEWINIRKYTQKVFTFYNDEVIHSKNNAKNI